LDKTDLDAIDGSDTGACFEEMLSMWLKQTKSRPTWSRMIKALKSRPVGFQQLAEHIEMNSGTKKRDKLPLKGTVEPDEEIREEIEFKERLRAQTRNIILEFNILENKLFDTLEHNDSVPKVAEYLEVYPVTSVEDMREFIINKSSFYDYEIMKCIICIAGTEEDKQRLKQYENHFEVYVRSRVYEVQSPSTSPMTPDSQSGSKLCIMLDSEYDKLQHNPDKLMQFQCRLCNLLKIPLGVSWSTYVELEETA
jgi:hypothetical protein